MARGYDALRRSAEEKYAEKSFAQARELYEQASRLRLDPQQQRWVAFRLADTLWRSDAANPTSDVTNREEARRELESLVRDSKDHDRVWAEAQESLGDYWSHHPYTRNPGLATPDYNEALEFWASSSDIAVARQRYLAIVFKMAESYDVPEKALVDAISIATTGEDRAHAQYLLALRNLRQPSPESVERGLELLDAVIAKGKTTSWYDKALFEKAQRLAGQGAVVVRDNDQIGFKPDYVQALALYRRIVNEYARGESPYYDRARSEIDGIVAPSVLVAASSTFLPRSEQEVVLGWRNVKEVELRLTAVNLVDDARFTRDVNDIANGLASQGTTVRTWTFTTNDSGDHTPGQEHIRITPKLDRGAYVIQAKAGATTSQQLVLVTDANILVHAAENRSDIFVCDALTGQPISGARVRVWEQTDDRSVTSRDATTNSDGIATLSNAGAYYRRGIIAASAPGNRQAYVASWWWYAGYYGGTRDQWRIYAFTDRPAYRPDEAVHWKFVARVRRDNAWVTPANDSVDYEIRAPRGEKIASGTAHLNAFGSFWSDLPLTSSMQLGQYQITFRHGNDSAGSAQLFRLEEYKLPEFRVDVHTTDSKFRLGDTVEASIDASYYFGGPVAGATVQAVVHSSPLYRAWYPWREYDWYFRDTQPRYGSGEEVVNETLQTDANGHAVLRIPTERDGQDVEFRIEARVTDESRREVVGEGTVRVTQHRYSVAAQPLHYIYAPGDKVSIAFKASDANDEPVRVSGNVEVMRREWHDGKYREESVVKTTAQTDKDGEATVSFNAPAAGYYAVQWASEDHDPSRRIQARDIIRSETTVWVTRHATTELGYRASGLEIILDKESFRSGQTAPVMIATPASGRWVMLTTSADGILDTQVLHLDGTVKLVEVPVTDRNVPSFYLTASSVFDRALATTSRRVVAPPVEHFVNVDVKADRDEYEPRQTGSFVITTRDVDGHPVAAEVAMAVADEAVTAIQKDPAGDPRQFFFADEHSFGVNTIASVQMQRYADLEEEKKVLIERQAKDDKNERDAEHGVVGGVVGGTFLDSIPMNRSAAVAEAITVTAAAPMVQAPVPKALKEAKFRGADEQTIEVQVRSDFRSTAFWQPDAITDRNGVARVSVKFPEGLTTWRATARAFTAATQVGMGSVTARTNMPLVVRLEGPRFFVAGDRATISAVINNNTATAMTVAPDINVDGLTLEGASDPPAINVPPHGESRADWTVVAAHAGSAKIRVTGKSPERGDAMEKTFPVFEHGIDKLVARSGKLRGDDATIKLDLPHARRATDLVIAIQPSLAAMMLDALPYLIDYPYGCTEQTMSRFLPAAAVAHTLGRKVDEGKLGDVTAKSLARLYDFQHSDGGWGWWKEDDSDDFMTSYVLWGFSIARESGIRVDEGSARRAVAYLDRRLVLHEKQWQDQAWMLHALAAWRKAAPNADERRAFDNAYDHRERLTAYARALLALAAHDFGIADRAAVLVRNLEDGVRIDRTPDRSVLVTGSGSGAPEVMGTAHWGEDRFWWRWFDGPMESTAFALQAIVRIDPQNALVEPVMNWLVKNRRGAQWNNTRDTAIAILALDDYLAATGELKDDVAYEVAVNGKTVKSGRGETKIRVPADLVSDTNEIRIRRTGKGAIYFSAEARFVSLEEPVTAAGNEIFVRREYFRLAGKPTLLHGTAYDRLQLADQGAMKSGERVDVVATIEAKNDYDYLMFEDLKPAGLEAVELQSGKALYARDVKSSRTVYVYQELRDRKVALFISHLPQGTWEIRYTLRAETPGSFHALPLLGQSMYVPEVKANGEEVRVRVE